MPTSGLLSRRVAGRVALVCVLAFGVARPGAAQLRAYAFLPLVDANVLVPVDTATNTPGSGIATAGQPVGVAASSNGRRVYTTNASGSITVVDVATLAPIATIPLASQPLVMAVSPDNRKGYVSRPAANAVTVVDLTTNAAAGDVALPGVGPAGIAFAPDGSSAYVVGTGLHRIDAATNAVTGSVALVGTGTSLAITSDGATAFVTLQAQNAVQVVNLATFTAGATIPVGASPSQLALSPDDAAVYVANTASNTVSVIAVSTRTVVATIPVGSSPSGIGFRPDGQRAYVANTASNSLSVIDTGTRAVLTTPGLGGSPVGAGGPIVTPPLIVPTGGPLTVATDAALGALGFRGYLPFMGGTLRVAGPVSIATSRHLSLLAPGGTIDTNASYLELSGNIDGPGALTYTDNGPFAADLIVNGVAAHTGGTVVTRGRLTVNGTHTASPITLTSVSTQLLGTGTVGVVTATAGSVAPGDGTLHASQVTFNPGTFVAFTVNGAAHSQLDVSGTAFLNGTGLVVTQLAEPTTIGPLTVVTNAVGTFEDLPEGGILVVPSNSASVRHYRVSYVGGDGNDVTITRINEPPTFTTIAPQATAEGFPLTLRVPVDDLDTSWAQLMVTATSSNQAIVKNGAGLTISPGPFRDLTITPEIGALGDVTITLAASDGIDTTTTSFVLSVLERSYYLAEGSSGPFFDTVVALANPNAQVATYQATFLKRDGTSVTRSGALIGFRRESLFVDAIPGLESAEFSTVVSSTNLQPLVVERTMSWDASAYGAHTEKAASGPRLTWYFAEGAQGYFSTYFLLVNPQPTANVAHVTYFREHASPLTRTYQLAPRSRTTIDAGADPELQNRSFGALITFDLAAAAERAMYFGRNPLWKGGHASFGSTAPSTTWFLAEGATGTFFTTFVLLANPNQQDVNVTLTYLPASGVPVTKNVTIPAGERITRNIALEDPSLANAAVATQVTASLPIVAERSQYWGGPEWIEAHNSAGVVAAATRWGLAEGRVGGLRSSQTYILLANPGTVPATVTVTFLRTDSLPLVKTFTVPPTSRFNIGVTGPGGQVPELVDADFGARIDSTQPIVVERSIYWNANGIVWSAGTNATGTRLP